MRNAFKFLKNIKFLPKKKQTQSREIKYIIIYEPFST